MSVPPGGFLTLMTKLFPSRVETNLGDSADLTFSVSGWNLRFITIEKKPSFPLLWRCLLCCARWFNRLYMKYIFFCLKCGCSNESSWAVLNPMVLFLCILWLELNESTRYFWFCLDRTSWCRYAKVRNRTCKTLKVGLRLFLIYLFVYLFTCYMYIYLFGWRRGSLRSSQFCWRARCWNSFPNFNIVSFAGWRRGGVMGSLLHFRSWGRWFVAKSWPSCDFIRK